MNKRGKRKISLFIFLSLMLCACGGNNSADLVNEYNSAIDELLDTKGFVMDVDASYLTEKVDQEHLKDNLTKEASKLQQQNKLEVDLNSDTPVYSLSTILISSYNNDTEESLIISKDNDTIRYIKDDTEEYVPEMMDNDSFDVIENIKTTLFYVKNDAKKDFKVTKKKVDDKTIYTMTLASDKGSQSDLNLTELVYEMEIDESNNIEKINGSYKMYTEINGEYQRTDYQCVITFKNINEIPNIDFLK